ncbi:MAG: sugar ABC transporter permease [Cellulomonadaceae bacterium]|nr:sugar ABC transporter permease [Cellulomonadaceae bacterium]
MATQTARVRDAATTQDRPPRRIGFGFDRGQWDVKVSPYLYISPFFIVFAVVGLFPLLYTAWVSLHEWSLIGGQGDFVGLDNFTFVLGQKFFWNSLRNTLSIFLLSSVPQVIAALVIAAMLDANLRAKTFWRMGVLLPYVVAPVAVAMVFSKMFADGSGMINTIIGGLGVDPIGWHKDTLASHIAIASMVNFRWTGYNALIFLAAMQAIPRDLYEAATVDGATRVRQFFSLTVPLVRPTMIFIVLTSTIGGLQIFDEPRMYDNTGLGGSSGQWKTVTLYLYELGWNQQKLGRAAAVAWLLFLLIIIFAILNSWLTRRIASADDLTRKAKAARKETRRNGKDLARSLKDLPATASTSASSERTLP